MTFEHLIASRFLTGDKNSFSRPLVRIATYTIALGVLVMIMAMSILRGFQKQISDKVVGFGSHITLHSYGWVNDFDEIPLALDTQVLQTISTLPGVRNINPYAYKGGMLKTDLQIQGIVFKGVDANFDTSFFARNIVRGRLPHFDNPEASSEIIISKRLSSRLGLDTGDKARTYFWTGDNYRARAFRIVGIYNTDLSEFDDHYIVGNISQIRRLNGWDSSQVAGYEILVDDFNRLDKTLDDVKYATPPDVDVRSVREQQPSMFAWLQLLNSNIVLILTIMALVCASSIVSALLIMIFEKTSMIGILKTLGATNRSIRRIFLIKATRIVGIGIIAGNLLALILSLLQTQFHILHLDTESYSMPFVPVDINLWYYLAISCGAMAICLVALLLPSTYISHIHPAKTVRIE